MIVDKFYDGIAKKIAKYNQQQGQSKGGKSKKQLPIPKHLKKRAEENSI